MTDIKFRAPYQSGWVYFTIEDLFYRHFWNEKRTEYIEITDGSLIGNIDRYTGLKDKNGVEIYEGDITYNDYTGTEREVIKFNGAWFFAEGDESGKQKPIGNDKIEVIGNIYENPELLHPTKEVSDE